MSMIFKFYIWLFNFSPIPPPVSGTFAGDLKNVMLYDVNAMRLVRRTFTSQQHFIEQQGVSYYDMIDGLVSSLS